ncbi:adenylate cyclase [Bradyrhizobium japonicum USDA 38]|uniref:adenylate/guanylate cyclase domain-containing protein n=1 Tax=Bradyrhizobium japonicum TaxID=375 RepID=UPI0004100E4A|nr:adenylate/guanylate cyclase domain-containing protein [Bradyrhizobium japonicum]MCS3891319.1 adenylate cyclase [Bradyrhizobium japonicum USDA 38]MCS3943835.1 adenylate cyclase [Bradyrhizobium japonicum]MCW2223469.1 adenylate cyclase [Bradyrhizobium japonicum]MCW2348081.1 adenylate cyclase [Bradyrhizobium japonicum]
MKRKIAAIFAADIAGYSRLVAEDEEETLRRLASYREVIDDFIAKANGRIFNTAGDAVLAEFPSAVDAVRCAIDIQESLRTRNMAYPPSRQMSFRIGITIGDVVERNGDLLGDGVNIAARLEGLAEVGGICVSRAVHEQVANKLSVQFADIGAQEVKNIPTPVHAYMVAMRREDGTYATPKVKKPASKLAAAPVWMWPLVVAVVSVVAILVTGFLYNTKLKQTVAAAPAPAATPSAAPAANAVAPSPMPTQMAKAPMAPMSPAGAAMAPMPAPSPAAAPLSGKLAVDSVPFINERIRNYLAGDYSASGDYKAFALNIGGFTGAALNQPTEEAARNMALEQCQKRADASQSPRRCELYAVGNDVVYTHGKPPMPPQPWVRHDAMTERAFVPKDFPMVRDPAKVRLENMFVPAAKSRAIALGPGGQYFMVLGASSVDDSARRSLESCGAIAGVACLIVAVDDNFVVPIPTLLRITGFFHAASNASIAADARAEVVRKLADGMGWNAVAVGTAGRPGLGLKAADEQTAVNSALADCAKRDSDCHVIAIGPFTVGPTN